MAEHPSSSEAKKDGEEDQELDEAELKRIEEEKQQAHQLGVEARSKAKAKLELKQTNKNAAANRPGEDELRRLDSSVKKNSTFVRKLRSLSEQQRTSLTSDLKSLNLTKYIQETAISIAEAKLKLADVGCAVHLSSLLHQRYDDFCSLLFDNLQKIYSTGIGKDEDKSAVTSKYRIGLRLLGELVIAGVVNEDMGLSLLMDMLTSLMKADSNGHPYLAVVVSFARHCVEDLAGIVPRKQRLLLTKYGIEPLRSELIPAQRQKEFREILHKYFSSVRDHMIKEHKAMHQRERRNRDIIFSKGEISEERRVENEAAQKAYDKLLTSTSTLAEVLDEDMPDLPEYKAPEDSDISIELQFPIGGAEGSELDPNSLWEDEDTRSFYEDIKDITPFVPAILFEGRKKKASESEDAAADGEGKPSDDTTPADGGAEAADSEGGTEGGEGDAEPTEEQDEEQLLEQMIKDTEAMALEEDESVPPPEDPEEEGGAQGAEQASASSILDEFLQRLPRLMNRKFVDEFAVEFCVSMNTKTNRRKLARALFNVEKNRMDLIPFYARLVATLHQCLDDIAPLLVEMLIKELRYQVYKKEQTRIDFKLKNVRFIAELTKFGMCPKIETMKCITILLHTFTHHNLEMACLFVEHCGRFLLRSPDSHLRAKALLQIMIRKKQVQHLDARQVRLVENALYYANPPDRPRITHERAPPMLEYIRKLLYKELTKVNTEKILRQVRKLPWGDPEVYQWAVTSLTQVWHVKYNNVHCMANLLAGLKSYQEDACVRVVDGVLEDIRLGLELNQPKLNQRRVSTLKYLGELYNYTLVESNVIFRTLYLLLSFGATPDGSPSPLDPHQSYFRVRLICLLLDTCGIYFDRGSAKKRLDAFLVFFQCYLFSKRQPLPLEVEHLVQDCIEMLRPDLEMYKTQQEAYEAALALEAKFKDKVGHSQEIEEEADDEEEDRGGGRGPKEEEEEEEERDDEEEEGDDEPENMESTIFEDEAVITRGPKLVTCHEDDVFVSQLDKLMSDDSATPVAKGATVDAAIPMHLKGGGVRQSNAPLLEDEGELKMAFKVMTKRGNKQQVKELNIPVDSGLAARLMDSREALKYEHRQMKELVLDYERRQEEEAYQAMIAETASKLQAKVKQPKKPAEPVGIKKVPSNPSMKQLNQQHPQKEYKSDSRSFTDTRYRDGRGRGRGRGRGGGRGGGQRSGYDQRRKEQDYQGN